jgi:hypothetical protein
MGTGLLERERRRITEIADEYRQRGYSVTIEPQADEVPSFIAPYRPDLIARGPKETVVIEVKAGTRTSADLADVATAVNSRPGWRFEVVLLDVGTQTAASELLPLEQLETTLAEVQRLLRSDLQTAAFVLLWFTTEGALRHAARRNKLEPDRDPRRLIRQLTSHGLITQTELQMLERSLVVRNNVAHGFEAGNLDSRLIQQLFLFARRLLEAGETVSDTFDFSTVSAWAKRSLNQFEGYTLEDAVFDRDAVLVHASDGATFPIISEQWTDIEPSERLTGLRQRLQQWAAAHLQQRHQ